MQKITPFLWFSKEAEPAARHYVSVFKRAKILKILRWPKGGPGKPGSVLTVKFRLLGVEFVAMNGEPVVKFTQAISFVVNCRTQAEVDYYWRRLSTGGKEIACGWLQDKYGVTWQITPTLLPELLAHKNPSTAARVMQAMMKMTKIDIRGIRQAAAGKSR